MCVRQVKRFISTLTYTYTHIHLIKEAFKTYNYKNSHVNKMVCSCLNRYLYQQCIIHADVCDDVDDDDDNNEDVVATV